MKFDYPNPDHEHAFMYLAHPITCGRHEDGDSAELLYANGRGRCNAAVRLANKLVRNGWHVYVPGWSGMSIECYYTPAPDWIEHGLAWLMWMHIMNEIEGLPWEFCLGLAPGWEKSPGVAIELDYARNNDLPVYIVMEDGKTVPYKGGDA